MSTSNRSERVYHHGDLRSALVEAGLKALETSSIGDLSLRQLARDVGVSATAVYRHFPDKQALLAALASKGLDLLGEFQQATGSGAAGEDAAFAAAGRAYVHFALANPALFRLIFTQCGPMNQTIFGENLAAQLLQAHARSVTDNPEAAQQLVIRSWAVVHGLAMLMLDGQLPGDLDLIDRVLHPGTLFARQGVASPILS